MATYTTLPGNVPIVDSRGCPTRGFQLAFQLQQTGLGAVDSDAARAMQSLNPAADTLPYFTSASAAALTTFTAFGRSLVDDANAAAARVTLGVRIGTDVQAYSANLAAFSAKTAPTGAVVGTSDTQTLTNKTLTAAILGGTTDLTGGQVKFPATQAPSADANTLDDYEEGTFTPAWGGTGSDPTCTYTQQNGVYTKIGRLVIATVEIVTTAVSGGAGNLRLAGLPVAAASGRYLGAVHVGYAYNFASNVPSGGYIEGGTSRAVMTWDSSGTGIEEVPIAALPAAAACQIIATVIYHAS